MPTSGKRLRRDRTKISSGVWKAMSVRVAARLPDSLFERIEARRAVEARSLSAMVQRLLELGLGVVDEPRFGVGRPSIVVPVEALAERERMLGASPGAAEPERSAKRPDGASPVGNEGASCSRSASVSAGGGLAGRDEVSEARAGGEVPHDGRAAAGMQPHSRPASSPPAAFGPRSASDLVGYEFQALPPDGGCVSERHHRSGVFCKSCGQVVK